MNDKYPVAFIGHGSPMNVISDNSFTDSLKQFSASLMRPENIVVVSSHWQTHGTFITGSPNPEQIYDFYGFPEELYRIIYKPAGNQELAKRIVNENSGVRVDNSRGLDHAAWAILKHIYPDYDIPVLEMSLDVDKEPADHYEFARQFAKYRNENILFIGSGNLVHNLSDISFGEDADPLEWAVKIDQNIKTKIIDEDISGLVNYRENIDDYRRAIPTNEHYLPLLYVLAMKEDNDRLNFIDETIQNGSISMRSFVYSR